VRRTSSACTQQFAHAFQLGRRAARSRGGKPVQHAPARSLRSADADALVVEHRAAAAAGGEQLVAQRVEDHPVLRLAVLDQGDRHAPVREAVQVVAGAVERVDHEHRIALALRAAFLAQERGIRVGLAQFLDDRFLGLLVDFAGVVHALFSTTLRRRACACCAAAPRRPRGPP
jgi:hypothetical protein